MTQLLSGPRYNIVNKDMYDKYKLKHPNTKMKFKAWRKNMDAMTYCIGECVASGPRGVKIDDFFGFLWVTECNNDKVIRDYTKPKESGLQFTNMHTNGKRYALKWGPVNTYKTGFALCYRFKGCRKLTRSVKPAILAGVKFEHLEKKDFPNTSKYWRDKLREYARNH